MVSLSLETQAERAFHEKKLAGYDRQWVLVIWRNGDGAISLSSP